MKVTSILPLFSVAVQAWYWPFRTDVASENSVIQENPKAENSNYIHDAYNAFRQDMTFKDFEDKYNEFEKELKELKAPNDLRAVYDSLLKKFPSNNTTFEEFEAKLHEVLKDEAPKDLRDAYNAFCQNSPQNNMTFKDFEAKYNEAAKALKDIGLGHLLE